MGNLPLIKCQIAIAGLTPAYKPANILGIERCRLFEGAGADHAIIDPDYAYVHLLFMTNPELQ
jgi:N-acyl-D-aspartate/D-glutamate deacylase